MTREQIEQTLGEYLSVDTVIWLGDGHPLDRDTDGHVDAIAQYVRPGVILLDAPADPTDLNHAAGQDNLKRLRAAHDAAGRPIEVVVFEAGTPSSTAYMNHYLVNGGVIVPADGEPNDDAPPIPTGSWSRCRARPSSRGAADRTASRSRSPSGPRSPSGQPPSSTASTAIATYTSAPPTVSIRRSCLGIGDLPNA
jgi:hypothetical protein